MTHLWNIEFDIYSRYNGDAVLMFIYRTITIKSAMTFRAAVTMFKTFFDLLLLLGILHDAEALAYGFSVYPAQLESDFAHTIEIIQCNHSDPSLPFWLYPITLYKGHTETFDERPKLFVTFQSSQWNYAPLSKRHTLLKLYLFDNQAVHIQSKFKGSESPGYTHNNSAYCNACMILSVALDHSHMLITSLIITDYYTQNQIKRLGL